MNNPDIDSAITDLKGKAKEAAGSLTGDTALQAEGVLDQGAGKVTRAAADAADAAREGAQHISEHLKASADRARQYAEGVTASLRDLAGTAWTKASDAGGKVYESGVRGGQKIGERVEKQPVLTALLAGVAGYLAAFLIHSSSSPLAPKPPPKRRWPF